MKRIVGMLFFSWNTLDRSSRRKVCPLERKKCTNNGNNDAKNINLL